MTYINTCDKEFPQDAKWGSSSNVPIFLSGSRISLSSACGTSQAAVDIAAFINRLSVHVLVDPMGWGSGHRQDVLAHRPASVQIGAIFPAAHACSYIKYCTPTPNISTAFLYRFDPMSGTPSLMRACLLQNFPPPLAPLLLGLCFCRFIPPANTPQHTEARRGFDGTQPQMCQGWSCWRMSGTRGGAKNCAGGATCGWTQPKFQMR